MNTLQNMQIFVRVVEARSFTAAAELLGISPGSASRAMNELEEHLRIRLLNRTTRRIALTSAGAERKPQSAMLRGPIQRSVRTRGTSPTRWAARSRRG